MLKTVKCPICSEYESYVYRKIGEFTIRRCQKCTVQFWIPADEFLVRKIYNTSYFMDESTSNGYNNYFSLEKGLRKTFVNRLETINKFKPDARVFLEIGSGPGFFLHETLTAGKIPYGVEISDFAAQYGREQLHVDVTTGTIQNVVHKFDKNSFDIVCMWDCIEHLIDPCDTISIASRLLKPNGQIWLSTGNAASMAAKLSGTKWHLYSLPEHLFFHTPKSIRILLEKYHFSLIYLKHNCIHIPASYVAERIEKTLEIRLPELLKRNWILPMNLFDVMTVGAELKEKF